MNEKKKKKKRRTTAVTSTKPGRHIQSFHLKIRKLRSDSKYSKGLKSYNVRCTMYILYRNNVCLFAFSRILFSILWPYTKVYISMNQTKYRMANSKWGLWREDMVWLFVLKMNEPISFGILFTTTRTTTALKERLDSLIWWACLSLLLLLLLLIRIYNKRSTELYLPSLVVVVACCHSVRSL